eukprot:TRINITY_DN95432_c0_g1_i1.p1 TRINITY_DN95432_c0_g1~~TRINITY_DN95432_c0_g1_i1.p1  ORF type:complete len:201 (-),score=53.08 TRINITY_DN95432_c0_g1_i1:102-704(-)
MSLVTGGMGGLGIIASFHMAAHTGAPIVSTSRSGRFSTPGHVPLQLMEAIQAQTLHFSVKCDAANAKELHDLLDVLARGIASGRERQTAQVDEVLAAVNRKMHILPPSALQSLLDLMLSVDSKVDDALATYRSSASETVEKRHVERLERQKAEVAETIHELREKLEAAKLQNDAAAASAEAASVSAAADNLVGQLNAPRH